jgi:hypothetical protein
MSVHSVRIFVALVVLVLGGLLLTSARGQQTAEPPLAAPADPHVQIDETIGLLSGLYLYQTYLNIGLLADAKAEKLYEERTTRAVLATVLNPLDAVDKRFARIGAMPQADADREVGQQMRVVVGLLRRQGQQLIAYWDSGNPTDGARYEATRQEAWQHLNAVLGMEKK